MALDIGDAVEQGVHRTLERNGLLLVAAFLLLNLASALLGLRTGPTGMEAPATVSGNPAALALIGIIVSLLSVVVSIAALRVFVTDETEIVPDEAFKRNMGNALLHTIIGGFLFGIAVVVGLILLVIPGVYLMLALFFWTVFVAVEDENFYEAMQSAWDMSKGHKWQLLGLVLVIVVINIVLSAVGAAAAVAGPRTVGMLVMQVLSAFGGVFALAAQARAYTQLT
ncbi:MAG: hypothetical protein SVW77_02165 [Candidatus Nanohaloarchaea archaeon]|nr:hypothetical protein [Candidatus Nanohaloarchaea archaeon]